MTRFHRIAQLGLALGLVFAQLSVHAAVATGSPSGTEVPATASTTTARGDRLPDGRLDLAMRMADPKCTYLSKRCAGGDGKACEAYFADCR